MDISEIAFKMTGTYSATMDTKRITGPCDDIDNLAEYIKEYTPILKERKPKLETKADAINLVWDYATYFFYCHIYTTTRQFDLAEEGRWFKDKICRLLAFLKKNGIELQDNWIYWQYAQIPLKEIKKLREKYPTQPIEVRTLKSTPKTNEFDEAYSELAKDAVKKFDPNADYKTKGCNPALDKAIPAEKSAWLDSNLKALKDFIATGECNDKHFAYVLYQLLNTRELGLPLRVVNEAWAHETVSILRLASFAAYIDNREELFNNVNNYLIDYFYWFLVREQPGRTDLDTWGGVSEHIVYSCAHKNYEGDLYTNIKTNDELNSWLQLLGFFDYIAPDEGHVIQRCFGYLFASPVSSDSLYFSDKIKNTFDKGHDYLKNHPGIVFSLYWMIHLLDEHDFNKVFLEDEKEAKPDTYCKENGIAPVEKRHYKKDSLKILQLLLFFILFDLSSKFNQGYYEKLDALAPLMEKIKDSTWHKEKTILELYNQLGQRIHLNSELGSLLTDCSPNDENIKSAILLVFNLAKFLRQDTKWLINEVNSIKEIQNKKLPILEHSKVYDHLKSDSLSETSENRNIKNQRKLCRIDSGFTIDNFMQKIPNFRNLVLGRQLTVKIFLDADIPTLYTDNKYYREQYRHLQNNKYAYFDRNMATHYAVFSKVEDLLKPYYFPDLLTSVYDLVHGDIPLKWFAMTDSEFKQINAYPYYANLLAETLDTMVNFLKETGNCKDGVFDSEGMLIPDRDFFKKSEVGKKFWEKHDKTELRDKLRDCFNLLYCNSDLMKWHEEYHGENDKLEKQAYADYDADFWTVYRYEIAVYLIKVAIELTALQA
ncbi:MAG: hypothetical protein J5791_04925 [Fibrobacter sp.]|nr:hypothetical protein [Fibrobacter sp.]